MDGEKVDTDVAAYIQASSNSTMVPLRVVALALGVDSANAANPDETNAVNWDANSKTATIVYGQGSSKTVNRSSRLHYYDIGTLYRLWLTAINC